MHFGAYRRHCGESHSVRTRRDPPEREWLTTRLSMSRSNLLFIANVCKPLGATLAIAALYIAACVAPAIEFAPEAPSRDVGDLRFLPDYEGGPHSGIEALAFGWMPPWTAPWLANIALFIGWILLIRQKNRAAIYCGVAGVLFGLST